LSEQAAACVQDGGTWIGPEQLRADIAAAQALRQYDTPTPGPTPANETTEERRARLVHMEEDIQEAEYNYYRARLVADATRRYASNIDGLCE